MPPHRAKHVAFSRTDTFVRAPNYTRNAPPKSSSAAQQQRLTKEIAKLEHEFNRTQQSREAYERKYEKSHNMRRKTEQARMMAFVEGCRAREAVLMDSVREAVDMLAIVQRDNEIMSRGYAKSYVDRMEAWRASVAREHTRRR